MSTQGQRSSGDWRPIVACIGLAVMVVCFVWLQLLPPGTRGGGGVGKADGPLSLIVIDAGHGGGDSGAVRDGVLEKDLTLDVARRLDQALRAKGLRTMMTRSGDEFVSLANRAASANEQRDCVFVSIHFDEGNRAAATGVNTYYATRQIGKAPLLPSWLPFVQPVSAQESNFDSQSLAGFVQQALVSRTRAVDRGTRSQQFYVIANVRHPAVLVEGGFLTNSDDMAKLRSEEYRQQLALAIGEGIMQYREVARERQATIANDESSA
ncbi:MAG: N-acetylmuramoyl-L-alanine amidase [Chthoniobacterales bacterium]|nr:N-acetylmuramoyl-L-alanine amidase [Chthoniobacterales bacterium]